MSLVRFSDSAAHDSSGVKAARSLLVSFKVAYIMSRFPTIAETFILHEMLELKRLGLHIEIFPLIHQKEPVKHAKVDILATQVHYHRLFSTATILAQLYWLYKKPKIYGSTWWE